MLEITSWIFIHSSWASRTKFTNWSNWPSSY